MHLERNLSSLSYLQGLIPCDLQVGSSSPWPYTRTFTSLTQWASIIHLFGVLWHLLSIPRPAKVISALGSVHSQNISLCLRCPLWSRLLLPTSSYSWFCSNASISEGIFLTTLSKATPWLQSLYGITQFYFFHRTYVWHLILMWQLGHSCIPAPKLCRAYYKCMINSCWVNEWMNESVPVFMAWTAWTFSIRGGTVTPDISVEWRYHTLA